MFFYEDVLRRFQEQRVKYLLVGGVAVNLLGALRSTADLDILVEMTDKNIKKVIGILLDLGYAVKQPVDPMDFADMKKRSDWIKNKHMKAFNFYKDRSFEEVDIIIDAPVSFQTGRERAIIVKVDDIRIPVVSIDDLIKMKRKAGRNIDKLDIEELQSLKKTRGIKCNTAGKQKKSG